jgi:hypothetical protein
MIRHNSREISNVMAELQTNVKQGAVIGGWVCFGVGTAFMFLSLWAFIFYAPLFLAAFVLSIVAMSQRRVAGGLTLLLCCVTIPPLTFLGSTAYRSQSRSSASSSSPSALVASSHAKKAVLSTSQASPTPALRTTPSPSPELNQTESQSSPTAALTTTPSSDFIKLVKPVSIQTVSGAITLEAGLSVPVVSRDDNNVRFHYGNAEYEIPVDATELAK